NSIQRQRLIVATRHSFSVHLTLQGSSPQLPARLAVLLGSIQCALGFSSSAARFWRGNLSLPPRRIKNSSSARPFKLNSPPAKTTTPVGSTTTSIANPAAQSSSGLLRLAT